MTGFIVFAHGSRVESANQAVRDVAARMAEAGGHLVESAFLELGIPDLPGAVDRLISRGVNHIVVIPYFLTLGLHMERDLPRIVKDISNLHAGVAIEVTSPLDGHPALVEILLDRAKEALA